MQHEQHRIPVTALAFYNQDVILSGEGCHLQAYNTRTNALLASISVFESQAIHGIVACRDADDSDILIWGGCFVRRLRLNCNEGGKLSHVLGPIRQLDDWILDAALCEHHCEHPQRRVALVSAHNALIIASLTANLDLDLEPAVPGSNCILYSAHVTWLSHSECLIASGTAFGDIIVWSCQLQIANSKLLAIHQIHYTFAAHEGSVFGLHISTPGIAAKLEGRAHVLASCSDDRTIRLWDISNLDVESSSLADTQRDTGFGAKAAKDAHAPGCLGKTMGHISRIWHARFVEPPRVESDSVEVPSTKEVYIVSFGEDAACIAWSLKPEISTGPITSYTFDEIRTQKAHNGKNIWSTAFDQTEFATGGADGSIALYNTLTICRRTDPVELRIGIPNLSRSPDFYRSYAFISPHEILTVTNHGGVKLLNVEDEDNAISIPIPDSEAALRGHSVVQSSRGYGFFGGSDGIVYSYCHATRAVTTLATTGKTIADIFCQELPGTSSIALLVTNQGAQQASLLTFCPSLVVSSTTFTPASQRVLDLPQGCKPTSFLSTFVDEKCIAILGSRDGSLITYSIPSANDAESISCDTVNIAVHAKETVTTLHLARSSDLPRCFLSTGRDGTYAVHHIKIDEDCVSVVTVHQLSLSFSCNVEGIGHSTLGNLWVWGFRNKHFAVYDVHKQQEIMAVKCGGVHRNWAFQPGETGGTFIWTKAAKLYHQRQNQAPDRSLNPGGHGREIKTVAVAPLPNVALIATGAEDTDIKISVREGKTWRCLHTLQKHVTGIQHLHWSKHGNYLFSSGGFEEFHVWKFSLSVLALVRGVGVICESTHPNSGKSDLRIMHFDVHESPDSKSSSFKITMLYSDSSLKMWSYDAQTKSWSLLASGHYLTSCLTQCLTANDTTLITASTDGHLAFWPLSNDGNDKTLTWKTRSRIHQNSILGFISHYFSASSKHLLITAGDDNALGLTLYATKPPYLATSIVPKAHSAAITGLTIIHTTSNSLVLVSASIDQRIKVWQIKLLEEEAGSDRVDVALLRNVPTGIADVSGIESVRLRRGQEGGGDGEDDGDDDGDDGVEEDDVGVLVCGVGMELWRVRAGDILSA